MKKLCMLVIALFTCLSSSYSLAANIAWDAPVALNGTFGTDQGSWDYYAPAAASTLTDGVFLTEPALWNLGSVWWNGATNPNNEIIITLGHQYLINGLSVQADDNDTYRIEFRVGVDDWETAFDIPAVNSWGLTTRSKDLGAGIWADALRFTATGGDGYYAVSEIQAYGTPPSVYLPEPGTLTLMFAGLFMLGLMRRLTDN